MTTIAAAVEMRRSDFSGREYPASEMVQVEGSDPKKWIHPSEFDAHGIRKADDTGLYHTNDRLIEVRHGATRRLVAGSLTNYFRCAYYGDYRRVAGRVRVRNWGLVSGDALEDSGAFFECERCGSWYHIDHRSGESGSICVFCAGEDVDDDDECDLIHDHCFKDFPPKIGKGPLYFGVELEVEAGGGSINYQAERTLELLGRDFAVLKGDGSLEHGFEIVTVPADYQTQMWRWDKFMANRPEKMRSFKTDTCGMHVHVSRQALSSLQLGKLLVFVNRPEHLDFIQDMAGRNIAQWAKAYPKKITDARKDPGDRYQAINVVNKHTIEFRIFKGTLTIERFKGNLEFVKALIDYTALAERSIAEATDKQAFIRYVLGRRKVFPFLYARLVKLDYLPKPAPRATPVVDEAQLALVNS